MALAVSEAEKPPKKLHKDKAGWEITVSKPKLLTGGWRGTPNNDKDNPPASGPIAIVV